MFAAEMVVNPLYLTSEDSVVKLMTQIPVATGVTTIVLEYELLEFNVIVPLGMHTLVCAELGVITTLAVGVGLAVSDMELSEDAVTSTERVSDDSDTTPPPTNSRVICATTSGVLPMLFAEPDKATEMDLGLPSSALAAAVMVNGAEVIESFDSNT